MRLYAVDSCSPQQLFPQEANGFMGPDEIWEEEIITPNVHQALRVFEQAQDRLRQELVEAGVTAEEADDQARACVQMRTIEEG